MLNFSSKPSKVENYEEHFLQETSQLISRLIKANASNLLQEMADRHFSKPGKMFRPRLVFRLLKALVFSEAWSQEVHHQGVAWAASLEILHNATLVHDDLQDGDLQRRGQPTTWSIYGNSQAINLGDLLMLLAPQAILQSEISCVDQLKLMQIFSKTSVEIVNGQSFEPTLNASLKQESLLQDYLHCISLKTSALFAGLAEGAAVIAKKPPEFQVQLGQLLLQLGNLFQIQDDLLDLYGEKQREARGCDIKEGKVSFLVVQHLLHNPNDHADLFAILQKPREETTAEEITTVQCWFDEKGTLDRVLREICDLREGTLNHQLIHQDEGLRSFVQETLDLMFQPIQHICVMK